MRKNALIVLAATLAIASPSIAATQPASTHHPVAAVKHESVRRVAQAPAADVAQPGSRRTMRVRGS